MSISIDPREVKEHLEYLGYSNISKDQLKDFIRDLKKLIKYEQKKANNVDSSKDSVEGILPVAYEKKVPRNTEENTSTNHVLIENQRRLTTSINSPQSVNVDSSSFICEPFDEKSLSRSYHANDYLDENLTVKECENHSCCCCKKFNELQTKSLGNKNSESEKPLKRNPSFIRPGKCKPAKCDPVALYHYYQNQWSRRPLPGEDPRLDLRWAIRTRLAQQPQQVPPPKISEGKIRKEWVS